MRALVASTSKDEKAKALDLLHQRYEKHMLGCAQRELRGRVVNGLEAQDVVHEVFSELLFSPKAEKFDESRPLRPWLRVVVRNKARDLLRCEQKYLVVAKQAQRAASARPGQTTAHVEVEDLFARLTADERKLCERFYLEDQSVAEIARERGTLPRCIYRDLHRLRTKLRAATAS